jgi:hypothetical protein
MLKQSRKTAYTRNTRELITPSASFLTFKTAWGAFSPWRFFNLCYPSKVVD